jgi:hypothetical protein
MSAEKANAERGLSTAEILKGWQRNERKQILLDAAVRKAGGLPTNQQLDEQVRLLRSSVALRRLARKKGVTLP